MVVLRLSEVDHSVDAGVNSWKVAAEVAGEGKKQIVHVVDAFTDQQEKDVRWYMEEYVSSPYEVSRAEAITKSIEKYGQTLALRLVASGLIPRKGDLELEIDFGAQHAAGESTAQSLANSGSSILRLHWEILEHTKVWPESCRPHSVSVRRIFRTSEPRAVQTAAQETMDLSGESTFNALLVVSRPRGREDIDYQLVSGLMIDILDRIGKDKATITILRPPTWDDFKGHLAAKAPGHYQLVHFDMHGKVTTKSGQVTANLRFSRYVKNQGAFATKGLLVPVQDIADVLVKAGVRCVIANACDSASTAHDSNSSNIAQVLVQAGIPSVLAMSSPILDSAVEIHIAKFYESLLLHGAHVGEAARDARQALLSNPTRRARFLHSVAQRDYFVPVYYQHGDIAPFRVSFDGKGQSKHGKLDKMFNRLSVTRLVDKVSRTRANSRARGRDEQQIFGRDFSVLEMEHILARKQLRKMLLYGHGGCGKTALLKYCQSWWIKTGLVQTCFYFDFATLLGKPAQFGDILVELSEALSAPSSSEEALLEAMRNTRTLLVFDSMETHVSPGLWERARFPPEELLKLWKFVERAYDECNALVIYVTRVAEFPSQAEAPGIVHYTLSGLPVSAATLQAEAMIRAKSPATASKLKSREDIDYLRRILILLEGNPEAINAVLPNLWTGSHSTRTLFEALLVGSCPIDPHVSKNSRFLRTIRSVHSEVAMFGRGITVPYQLFPFWTLIPRDLRVFYYFMSWKAGALSREFAQERSYAHCFSKYFEADIGIVSLLSKINDTVPPMLEKMKKAGILHDAEVTFKDSEEVDKEVFYHVHPLFTLCARDMVEEGNKEQCIYAFVRHQTLFGKTSIASRRKMTQLVWDNEPQLSDHLTNNHLAAVMLSLESDILAEVAVHGMSMTDILLADMTEGSFHNRRLGSVLAPVLQRHLVRLITLPHRRGDGRFTQHEMSCLLTYSERYAKEGEGDPLSLINAALNLARSYRADAEQPWEADMDQSWFELHLLRCRYILQSDVVRAKQELEAVLATDPATPITDSLFPAIRRVFVSLLMEWMRCAATLIGRGKNLDDKETARTGAKEGVKYFELGKLEDLLRVNRPDVEAQVDVPVRDGLAHLLEPYAQDVARFGSLANVILDEPMWRNYAAPGASLDEYLAHVRSDQSLQRDLINGLEYQIRTLAGQGATARHLVNGMLDQQATASSSGWKELAGIHEMMYLEAVDNDDWRKALQHLEEMEKLELGQTIAPGQMVHQLVRFAMCLDQLGEAEKCARRVLQANELLLTQKGLVDDDAERFFLNTVAGLHTPDQLLSRRNALSILEGRKLRGIMAMARDYKTRARDIQERREKLEARFEQIRLALGAAEDD